MSTHLYILKLHIAKTKLKLKKKCNIKFSSSKNTTTSKNKIVIFCLLFMVLKITLYFFILPKNVDNFFNKKNVYICKVIIQIIYDAMYF